MRLGSGIQQGSKQSTQKRTLLRRQTSSSPSAKHSLPTSWGPPSPTQPLPDPCTSSGFSFSMLPTNDCHGRRGGGHHQPSHCPTPAHRLGLIFTCQQQMIVMGGGGVIICKQFPPPSIEGFDICTCNCYDKSSAARKKRVCGLFA